MNVFQSVWPVTYGFCSFIQLETSPLDLVRVNQPTAKTIIYFVWYNNDCIVVGQISGLLLRNDPTATT